MNNENFHRDDGNRGRRRWNESRNHHPSWNNYNYQHRQQQRHSSQQNLHNYNNNNWRTPAQFTSSKSSSAHRLIRTMQESYEAKQREESRREIQRQKEERKRREEEESELGLKQVTLDPYDEYDPHVINMVIINAVEQIRERGIRTGIREKLLHITDYTITFFRIQGEGGNFFHTSFFF